MVASAFDHRDGAGIAHRKAFAGDAAEIAFALDRAVEHGVADDDRFLRLEAAVGRRANDEAAAREALADIVVGVAFELEGYAAREPGAEALSGRTGQTDMDGVVGQPFVAIALRDLAREHRACGAVGVADRARDLHLLAALERTLRLRDQLAIENLMDLVVLRLAIVDRDASRRLWLEEQP